MTAYVIGNACVNCGSCAVECPVSVIPEEDSQYVIDVDACINCGIYAATCLTGATSED